MEPLNTSTKSAMYKFLYVNKMFELQLNGIERETKVLLWQQLQTQKGEQPVQLSESIFFDWF